MASVEILGDDEMEHLDTASMLSCQSREDLEEEGCESPQPAG